jgi:hypothetical protein
VYAWFSGRFRWSMRSSPQFGGLFWVSSTAMRCTASIEATDGSAANRATCWSDSATEKPRKPAV